MILRNFGLFIALTGFTLGSYAACNIVNGQAYGDCTGSAASHRIKGAITVSSYRAESGIIDGARVVSGGSLHLSGIANGDISVSRGGVLLVTGIVNGTVKNNGGTVEIEGRVSNVAAISGKTTIGGIVTRVSGNSKVIYKSGAVIGGKPKP